MFWRRVFKILHELGSAGVIGAFATILVLVLFAPSPTDSLPAYAATRLHIATVSKWVLTPSLLAVLVSGLGAMALNPAYHDAGWAWVKALTGLAMFEGTLLTVDATARRTAEWASAALQSGTADLATLEPLLRREQGGLWALLAIALANVVLGVWRPRFRRAGAP